MEEQRCTAIASLDGLLLNNCIFNSQAPHTDFIAVLGMPDRIVEPLPPAPYGHRNNQIHLYDELGLYLLEDHATRLINSIVFILWPEESPFRIARDYSGELTVGGISVRPGMLVKEMSNSTINFNGPELGLWTAEKNGVWIGLKASGIRLQNGKRGKRIRLESVSVCFG